MNYWQSVFAPYRDLFRSRTLRALIEIQGEISALRKEVRKLETVATQIENKLAEIDVQLTAVKNTSMKLVADVEALIAKNAGGNTVITNEELQGILAHGTAIRDALGGVATVEASADTNANPPATPAVPVAAEPAPVVAAPVEPTPAV